MAPPPRRSRKRSPAASQVDDTPATTRSRNTAAGPQEASAAPIALVLIDDNRLLREGIVAMIRSQQGFNVLTASANAAEALEKVREEKPDIVLVDFGLEDQDSLGLTATFTPKCPRRE